jgi:hypothetical protein
MDYSVDRIPGNVRIDPDAGGQERQGKRGKPSRKSETEDSVSISEEARKRSSQEPRPEPEEPQDR